MKTPNTRRGVLFSIRCASLIVVAVACPGGGGAESGGGVHTDQRDCTPHPSDLWINDSTELLRTEPRQCPYTVAAVGNPLLFAFFVDVLASHSTGGQGLNLQVVDGAGATRLNQTFFFDQQTPNRLPQFQAFRATVAGSYAGGYPSFNGGPPNDLATLAYRSSPSGELAIMQVDLPGQVDGSTGTITPPDHTNHSVGVPDTWRVIPAWDTTSYQYAWDLDGAPVGTGASATVTLNSVGNFTLHAVVTRSDNTSYTLTQPLSTVLSTPNITGTHSLDPNTEGLWNASPVGGVGPYRYTWIVDGVTMQDGSGSDFSYTPQNSFGLTLLVHDARGASASGGIEVTVSSCGTAIIC